MQGDNVLARFLSCGCGQCFTGEPSLKAFGGVFGAADEQGVHSWLIEIVGALGATCRKGGAFRYILGIHMMSKCGTWI